MVPLWKINREIKRIGLQIRNIPAAIADLYELAQEPRRRREHFAKLNERVAVIDGKIAETDRVVIFLIYQPDGISQSTIELCENMIDLGFSPFLVTNSKLSPADEEKLRTVAWKIMTRPNFGYDFGGYQDALFALRKIKDDLEYLIVMNDSVWLEFSREVWQNILSENAHIVGLVRETKMDEIDQNKVKYEYQNLQSYFYFIKSDLWKSPVFWEFWLNYKMVNNKKRTIKNGEILFTKFLDKNNIAISELITKEKFLEKVYQADNHTLKKVFRYASFLNTRNENDNHDIFTRFQDRTLWREEAIKQIKRTISSSPLNGSYWVAVCILFKVNLIKKNKEPINCKMRKSYLEAIDNGETQTVSPKICAELRDAAKVDSDKIQVQWSTVKLLEK